jgi:hypothetical protein
MSGYKGLNNPNTNDLLKNHMNAITNTSRSARLYGRLFAFQDTALFVVNKLKEKSFELKDLQKFITSNGHSNGSLTNQK